MLCALLKNIFFALVTNNNGKGETQQSNEKLYRVNGIKSEKSTGKNNFAGAIKKIKQTQILSDFVNEKYLFLASNKKTRTIGTQFTRRICVKKHLLIFERFRTD